MGYSLATTHHLIVAKDHLDPSLTLWMVFGSYDGLLLPYDGLPLPYGSYDGLPLPYGSYDGLPLPYGSYDGLPLPYGSYDSLPLPYGSYDGLPLPYGSYDGLPLPFPYPMMVLWLYPLPVACSPRSCPLLLLFSPLLLLFCPALLACALFCFCLCRHDELAPIVHLTRQYVAVYIHPLHTYTTPVCGKGLLEVLYIYIYTQHQYHVAA